MSDFPRADLIRMVDTTRSRIEVRAEGDGNELVGYGAVFNDDTEINGWEGHFIERIMPGAFKRTLEQRGDRVKIQFDHGMDTRFGGAPIAVPVELREDGHGLFVRAKFVDTEAGRDARELIRSGAVDGMSFRFSVKRDQWDDEKRVPVRTIQEVELYEVGPVTWPAYEATTVGVRSAEALALLRNVLPNHRPELALLHGGETIVPTHKKTLHIKLDGRALTDSLRKELQATEPADSGTSDADPSDPPTPALAGAHKKRVEQARRRLARRFPEVAEEQS